MRNSILSTTCCLATIGALTALTLTPDDARTAPPVGQVSKPALTAAPAPLTVHACQCDPQQVADLEARIAHLEAQVDALQAAVYTPSVPEIPDNSKVQQQPAAATVRSYRIVQPQASGYCVGGNCSTSRGRVFGGVFRGKR